MKVRWLIISSDRWMARIHGPRDPVLVSDVNISLWAETAEDVDMIMSMLEHDTRFSCEKYI